MSQENLAIATLGTGCFWCTEAVFQNLDGVLKVESGYSGGFVENPTYEEVCDRNTGHAECLRITFDPAVISYDELLEVFWQSHDPTTLNRQGNDVGPQYRSVIFYHDESQHQKAAAYKKELTESNAFEMPVVTQIEPAGPFYKAEDYHNNYYLNNPLQGYCHYVIKPKVDKIKKVFAHKLKTN